MTFCVCLTLIREPELEVFQIFEFRPCFAQFYCSNGNSSFDSPFDLPEKKKNGKERERKRERGREGERRKKIKLDRKRMNTIRMVVPFSNQIVFYPNIFPNKFTVDESLWKDNHFPFCHRICYL